MVGSAKGITAMLLFITYLVFSNLGMAIAAGNSPIAATGCVGVNGFVHCPIKVGPGQVSNIEEPSTVSVNPTTSEADSTFSTVTIPATREILRRQTVDPNPPFLTTGTTSATSVPDPIATEPPFQTLPGHTDCDWKQAEVSLHNMKVYFIEQGCKEVGAATISGKLGYTWQRAKLGIVVSIKIKPGSGRDDVAFNYDYCVARLVDVVSKCSNEVSTFRTKGGHYENAYEQYNIWVLQSDGPNAVRARTVDATKNISPSELLDDTASDTSGKGVAARSDGGNSTEPISCTGPAAPLKRQIMRNTFIIPFCSSVNWEEIPDAGHRLYTSVRGVTMSLFARPRKHFSPSTDGTDYCESIFDKILDFCNDGDGSPTMGGTYFDPDVTHEVWRIMMIRTTKDPSD